MAEPAEGQERNETAAQRIARRFHETYEELAPAHGYETRKASAVPWSQVPSENRRLMVATVLALMPELKQLGRAEGYEQGRHAAASDILARLAVALRYVEDNSDSEVEAPNGDR